jgi:hypothetical protein
MTTGDPCVVKVSGATPDAMTVTEVRPSVFIDSPGSNQAGSVQRGIFSPGAITRNEDPHCDDPYPD